MTRYSILRSKNEQNHGFCSPFESQRAFLGFSDFVSKSSFRIFWGVEIFFWKKNFVVKISTTKKFSQKKVSTDQNFRKPDFREITKNRHREQNRGPQILDFQDFRENLKIEFSKILRGRNLFRFYVKSCGAKHPNFWRQELKNQTTGVIFFLQFYWISLITRYIEI